MELSAAPVADHPCMSDQAHHRIARIHLPVASRCNIRCAYCERKIGPELNRKDRPGICEKILSPKEAVNEARDFLCEQGEQAVVGIAGPGDPLANPETFATLSLINRELPHARLCLCTNGLNLPGAVEKLKKMRVAFLSVTVNGVDPNVTAQIHSGVRSGERRLDGIRGAGLLLKRQVEGIQKALEAGIYIKVNTVVIPGINDRHITEIAKFVSNLGVGVFNPMPLIPAARLGHCQTPDAAMMAAIYKACHPYLHVFRSCKQCRADARGIPGKESCKWKKIA
jgi:nitrogen fixation protein NifB